MNEDHRREDDKTFSQLPDTQRAKLGLMDITEICRLYEHGLSSRRIGERLGLNHKTVLGILKEKWYQDVPRLDAAGQWVWNRPPTRPNTKLTDEDVATVFRLRAQGWTQGQIARAVGCSPANIGCILRGQTRITH